MLATLFTAVNNIAEPETGVTMLNRVVDNRELCGQHNIALSFFNNILTIDIITHVQSSVLRRENFSRVKNFAIVESDLYTLYSIF